jgi:hypothetical protein
MKGKSEKEKKIQMGVKRQPATIPLKNVANGTREKCKKRKKRPELIQHFYHKTSTDLTTFRRIRMYCPWSGNEASHQRLLSIEQSCVNDMV